MNSLKEYEKEEQDLLLKKGIYPYEYISDFNILYEKELPPIEKFYSKLSKTSMSEENYKHGKKFGIHLNVILLWTITIYTYKLMLCY